MNKAQHIICLLGILTLYSCSKESESESSISTMGNPEWGKVVVDDVEMINRYHAVYMSVSDSNELYVIINLDPPKNSPNGYGVNVYKTVDGGYSWFSVYQYPNGGASSYRPFRILSLKKNVVYMLAAESSLSSILISYDGGEKWWAKEIITGPNIFRPTNLSVINEQTFYLCGTGIKKSFDGGDSWINYPEYDGGYFTSIEFPTESVGFVVGGNLCLKTANSGLNWDTSFYNPSTNLTQVKFLDSLTGCMAGNKGVFLSIDGGLHWDNTYNEEEVISIALVNQYNFFAVTRGGRIIESKDGGWSWKLVFELIGDQINLIETNGDAVYAGIGVYLHSPNDKISILKKVE